MQKTISIQAPPFHVQSTALLERNGFPYFAYHDSVSALWTSKWKPSAERGICPFSEARAEDFEGIFRNLVAASGDNPSFLFHPDEYAKPLFPVAEKLESAAQQAEERKDRTTARAQYLRAASVYRLARFPIPRSELGLRAWGEQKRVYARAVPFFDNPPMAVDIPFTHANPGAGDLVQTIPAYLQIPAAEKPKEGWPLLLLICGLDGFRVDVTFTAQTHLEAGRATLTFEIPGTGDSPAAPNDPRSCDRLMDSILDWVAAKGSEFDFDLSKVLVHGVSTGGYYAIRAAHTHAGRLHAVVAQGGTCHHVFNPAWIKAQDQMEYPFALAQALAFKFGHRSSDPVESYAADAGKFSLLAAGILDRPNTRLLLVNGMEDSVFPIEDNFLAASSGRGKDLVVVGNSGHMGETRGQRADRAVAEEES